MTIWDDLGIIPCFDITVFLEVWKIQNLWYYKSAGVPVAKSQGILWVIVGPTVQAYATAWEYHTSLHSLHKAK